MQTTRQSKSKCQLVRRALIVSVFAVSAIIGLAVLNAGKQSPANKVNAASELEQRKEQERLNAEYEANREQREQATGGVKLRMVGLSEGSVELDAEDLSLADFDTAMALAGVVIETVDTPNLDAASLLTELAADRADALIAGDQEAVTVEDVAAALGVIPVCDDLGSGYRKLHRHAEDQGLALLQLASEPQTGALPNQVLVIRTEALTRFPDLEAAVAVKHMRELLGADDSEAIQAAGALLGEESEVPAASSLRAAEAALNARLEELTDKAATSKALEAAFELGHQGKYAQAASTLRTINAKTLNGDHARALNQIIRQLGTKSTQWQAIDKLMRLMEQASDSEVVSTDALLAVGFRQASTEPSKPLTLVCGD